jgi:hypothetical protein
MPRGTDPYTEQVDYGSLPAVLPAAAIVIFDGY